MSRLAARELRENMTEAERKLWTFLRSKQINGFKFRRQCLVGKFIVDFVCFEKKIILEVDGGQHMEQEFYDIERTNWLESQGFRVLRFWNHEVLKQTEAVLEKITPHLSPCLSGRQ